MADTTPKKADLVAQELKGILEKSGKNCVTLPWADVYAIAERKHWTDKAHEETRDELHARGVTIGYGKHVVIVAKDENFAPVAGVSK
ncbi:hypothetical protein CSR02_05975 [Acetobacter pomorum]|uniref:Uncharacterized protein n=1 Tax=Acetobacter pomorum TaxID=65959 RepID=A0A2G4RCB7_9PROT|nr:hypothetical protein [Acetobacter pomorum]PHY94214.1 hypothetical protein CSR02_05975 [Acetobacter pomorum]GBR52406.1 hypothetical protein AA11825_2230 [Acetobacter pomorum DSM 11825]